MSLYSIALFMHIVGVLLTFALMTVEGVAFSLRFTMAAVGRIFGPISAAAILVPGLYMTATQWGWKAWIVTGLVSYVVIAGGGAVTGISLMRGRISRDTAVMSWLARIGIALGVVFDMTIKPDALWAVTAIVVAALIGAAAGAMRSQRTQSA